MPSRSLVELKTCILYVVISPTPIPHTQLREVQEAGSRRTHFANPWNVVEIWTLVTISIAIVFRIWAFVCSGEGKWLCGEIYGSPVNEVYFAQYFQAISAPLVLGRVLFLTQVRFCRRSEFAG